MGLEVYEVVSESGRSSTFTIGPLRSGQSFTIGTVLRRALLSDLEGVAIAGLRIEGVNHEFARLPGIKEDVIDILLNVKQIGLCGVLKEPYLLAKLMYTGPGFITAKDVELPDGISLLEPNQYIASVSDNKTVKMEFLIKRGRGYELGPVVAPYELGPLVSGASETGELSEFLATGAVYMPVKAVTFSVEPIVGVYWDNVTSEESERLLLEVSTNGSITPAEAINAAIDTIRDFLKILKDRFVPTTIENSQNSQLEEFFS